MSAPDPHQDQMQGWRGGRVSLQTLFIASAASAAASFVIARIWGPGTLIGAAAAPVIVALLSEFLHRPVRAVTATAKRLPTVRMTPVGTGRAVAAAGDSTVAQPEPDPVATSPAAAAEPRAHAGSPPSRWPWAVLTGVAAFVTVVAVYTLPELLAGRSITGNGQPTTFFGGSSNAGGTTRRLTTTVTTQAPATVTVTTPGATTTQPTTTATGTPATTATGAPTPATAAPTTAPQAQTPTTAPTTTTAPTATTAPTTTTAPTAPSSTAVPP